MMLLLMGGSIHEAWAQTKTITYHVITLEFGDNTGYYDGSGNFVNEKYRIEAIKKTVTQDVTADIKLPAELKSPLMKYEAYSYYTGATRVDKKKIFPDNDSQFYTYTFESATNVTGQKVNDLTGTDVYVTYIWDDDHENLKEDYGKKLDLTGGKEYNVEFTSSSGTGSWFYALNMDPGRGNRGQAVPFSEIKQLSDLYAEDWAIVKRDIGGTDRKRFNFRWKLTNNDPYNIILQTAYNGEFQYREDNYYKKNKGAQYFGSLKSSTEVRGNWVTNEINQAYTSTSSVVTKSKHGWFRGYSGEGRASKDNGVKDHLFFSFTLLAHPTANYTLAASYVNVDEGDWVPNSSGKYLLMQHDPENLPYAGPKFLNLTAADQVRLYEIRDYNFKVKTPLSNTILSTSIRWSDYGKDSLLINYVPDALKRKYTSITGTYTTDAFTTARAKFSDLYENDEPEIHKVRDVWLKYEVSSIPFEAGTGTSTFTDMKWYNIYVNKEEKYTTWYDTSGEPALNQFSTSEGPTGHTKYAHESHFSFIGDPYELRVANRLSSENASDNLRYMKLDETDIANSLASGEMGTFRYKAVPEGTALTIGKKYYIKDSSTDQFTSVVAVGDDYYEKTYIGQVSDGSNYYEKKDHFVAVANGTTLTKWNVYYTSDKGDGIFVANGTEVSDGTNYYEYDNTYYVAVPNGTRLTVGKTYYTYNSSEDKYEIHVPEYLVATGSNYYEKISKSDWEIINDNNTGDYAGCFRLRQFNTYDSPVTIGWDSSGKRPLNGDGSGGSTMARLSVLELPMMYYYYYIVDKNGRIAVMAKEEQITGTTLNYDAIPEVIRSPFLALGAADRLTFWTYKTSSMSTVDVNMKVTLGDGETGDFVKITTTNSVEADEYKNHIFVSYDTSKLTAMTTVPLKNDNYADPTEEENNSFNVILNNEYIYYDVNETDPTKKIKSKANFNGTGDSPGNMENLWVLGGEDPYAMIIRNKKENKYVKVTDWAEGSITWVSTAAEATRFIIKSSTGSNMYEVMATTSVAKGGDNKIDVANSVDASSTYYNIGRTDVTTVKMYSNEEYAHGYAVIRFQLKKSSAKAVKYILIDKSYNELLEETGRYLRDDVPQIPAEIFSPLVGYENYTYWNENPVVNHALDNTKQKYGENERFSKFYTEEQWNAAENITVWITYVANDLVDMNHTTMYLLKYEQGDLFRQENGSDGLLDAVTSAQVAAMNEEQKAAYIKTYQAVYPYCNGDGNFFVYGQQQYETQQEGAASTRTRWAWYIESGNHDPYHVKILSRQTETYDGLERSAYFSTRKFEGWDKVVTGLVWPNISGVQATEYMVLGSVGQYQLVTTPTDNNGNKSYLDPGEDPRYVVDSFEQYWKTYDTVKKKLLSDLLPNCLEKDRTDRVDGSIEVPTEPSSLRTRLTGTGEGQYGFHSYQKMANAKRWNGYNASGEKKKGWETREHWFQTVKMGSGYFDLIPTEISPALILLDQHGWEIMRKPLPYSDKDPNKEAKKDVLRTYDSPMVKEYIFWASAKKRSGLHQYYLMDKRIGGSTYSSTSLGDLPPWGSENVSDAKGNQYDEYVTYIVKEEYAISYDPTTQKGTEFLIRQGTDLAKNNNNGVGGNKVSFDPDPGSVSQYIINNISTLSSELWYVKPNADIDNEMGYGTTSHDWGTTNPNAYEDAVYGKNQVAQIITNSADVTKYGKFSFSNGFDPYNIQISSITGATPLYFTTGMTGANVSEGAMVGTYGSISVTLAEKATTTVVGNGYDNSKWAVTNQTFMAVQDLDGNMQLMPRFDHNLRMRDFATLVTPTAEAEDEDKLKETYTQLYRPFVYNYRIIDNEGHESLRYQSGGDLLPQTADHLKSPLAKDFKYYKDLNYNDGTKTYTEIANKNNISSKEITTSLVGAGLKTSGVTNGNIVYVRYTYDEDADVQYVLQGKWLTMKLNEKDAVYNGGIKQFDTENGAVTKPNPIVGNTDKGWQWKFLRHPYTDPDPYAVQMFNRNATDLPMRTPSLNGGTVGTSTSENDYQRFALLSHEEGGYALTVAGTEQLNYYFLNGYSMTTSVAAITAKETGVTGAEGNFDDTKSQILLTDEVVNDYTYKVYTHGGVEAISETQTHNEASDNDFVPQLPEAIKTPLLNYDQFRYYEALTDTAYNSGKTLKNLYGLYDNEVFVRYNAYDQNVSEYKVPNERNATGTGTVAKGNKSNDAPLRLDDFLPHNIIWYNDNMMKQSSSSITDGGSQNLQNSTEYAWTFAGNDPYAIKIRHKNTSTYVHEGETTTCSTCSGTGLVNTTETCPDCHGSKSIITCNLDDATPTTTFMLLNRDGYENGVLAVTGHKEKMLTEYGNQLTATDRDPNKFIIFSLGTLQVIYHLVIANIEDYEDIPYRHRGTGENKDLDYSTEDNTKIWNDTDGYYKDFWADTDTLRVHGTTKRDLTTSEDEVAGGKYQLGENDTFYPLLPSSADTHRRRSQTYCKNVGPISLGDGLTVPEEFYRPNVNYFFVVHEIGDIVQEGSPATDVWQGDDNLNKQYKGLQITSKEMSLNEDLIGKTIYIDILYRFNTDLESNSGDNFVMSVDQNKWYTLETVVNNKTYLAQYTNAWGFELKEGRGSHYTNDFLWTPIGDPYGFQLFNRYMDVNSGDDNLGEKDRVIFSRHFNNNEDNPTDDPLNNDADPNNNVSDKHKDGQQILMGNYINSEKLVVVGRAAGPIVPYPSGIVAENSIYELLESSTPGSGYFRFHPVANTKDQTQVYFNPAEADDDGDNVNNLLVRLSTTAAEFTFGLSAELMKPYFDRAGYVGGLTKKVYNDSKNAALVTAMKANNPVLSVEQLMAAQALVYNFDNIVPFESGYYRLHSPLGISGIDPSRYVSGYTHLTELTGDGELTTAAIPMHFFEKNSDEIRQFTDFKEGGFIPSHATRGDITIPPVVKDPASIFYFEKNAPAPPVYSSDEYKERYAKRFNLGYISTQGLYVKGEKGQAYVNGAEVPANVEQTGERPAALMTDDKEQATKLFVMDLGGGVLLIHDNVTASGRRYLKYLSYDYSNDTDDNPTIYNMKLTNHTHTDHAKFCMQPVQESETLGINELPLKLDMKQDKGNNYYYASFCAPFDVLLTDADNDMAFICKVWDTEILHLKRVGLYNTEAHDCPADYRGSNQFVPAGTPVIIRSNKSVVTLALPTKTPSTDLAKSYKDENKIGNIFMGKYLEQLLPSSGAIDVYTFGYPMTAKEVKTIPSTGVITFDQQKKSESGMGFYINATPNREYAADMGSWIRNNWYVYGNKIYYRPGNTPGASAPKRNIQQPDFIPVVFDDDDADEDIKDDMTSTQRIYDNRVYDLQGRCVATEQEVKDGTWKLRLPAGVYILNGKKVMNSKR